MRSSSLHALVALPLIAIGCSGAADDESGTTPAEDSGLTSDDASDDASPGDDTGAADTATTDEGSGVDGDGDGGAVVPGATQPNLKVAFIGDQGANSNTIAVEKLIKSEGAQFVIILGDFDYSSDAEKWDKNLNTGFGADFPVFAAIGNHDLTAWPDYKEKLEARLARIPGAKCTGDYGTKMSCTYLGLFFVLSGVGTQGTRSDHEAFLRSSLTADKSLWRVCAWHKNQQDMQLGDKGDEVGWPAYQICQNNGALVMTGHEHSYSRTKTLNAVGNRSKGHGAFGDFDKLVVKSGMPGNTFVTVSGLGGVGIRDFDDGRHADDTWWASWYAVDGHVKNGAKVTTPGGYGATFVTFNVDGDPKKARGYFKNVAGVEIDRFEIRRE